MGCTDFHGFVEKVCQALEAVSASDPHRIAACKSGEDFEVCVVEAVHTSLDDLGLTATVHYTPGGHAFPDIVIEFSGGEKYGIEVKSSTSATLRRGLVSERYRFGLKLVPFWAFMKRR